MVSYSGRTQSWFKLLKLKHNSNNQQSGTPLKNSRTTNRPQPAPAPNFRAIQSRPIAKIAPYEGISLIETFTAIYDQAAIMAALREFEELLEAIPELSADK